MEYCGSLWACVPMEDDGPSIFYVVDENAQVYGGPLPWELATTLLHGLERALAGHELRIVNP